MWNEIVNQFNEENTAGDGKLVLQQLKSRTSAVRVLPILFFVLSTKQIDLIVEKKVEGF